MIRPAIVVVGYNRKKSLLRLLRSIVNANYSYTDIPLIISLDKSDKTPDLIAAVEQIEWKHGEKHIQTFEERQGLRQHILKCGDLSNQYGAVIILEDDLVVSPEFYHYTVQAIEFYEGEEDIAGFALYSHRWNGYANTVFEPIHNGYDSYLGQFGVSWGQCWTVKQWKAFRDWYMDSPCLSERSDIPKQVLQWDEKSWGKYFNYYIVSQKKYYVMPYIALSTCFSEPGEHTLYTDAAYQVPLLMGEKQYCFARVEQAEKYNMFFEYECWDKYIDLPVKCEKLCVDLNAVRDDYDDYDYLLTTQKHDYKVFQSYGMEMRPLELNVIYSVEGEGIYLYDLHHNERICSFPKNKKLYYDMHGIPWRKAMQYAVCEVKSRVMRKFM